MSVKILALVGSLRSGSHNRQLAEAARSLAPSDAEIVIFDGLGDLPFYNEDIDTEADVPAAATRLREVAGSSDAFLLFSPEYNGTIPAVLKNAIDWLSRPFGASALSGKPTAVIGTAFGQYGGVWAQDETRKSAGIAGASIVDEIKLSIPGSMTRFAETHPADDPEVVEQLTTAVAKLTANISA